MGPALNSVPTENSFAQWVQQFTKLVRNNQRDENVNGNGLFNSIKNHIVNSINNVVLFYSIMNNYTVNFLFFGFMRLAICTNKADNNERYIFVGIFNTWIPTPF